VYFKDKLYCCTCNVQKCGIIVFQTFFVIVSGFLVTVGASSCWLRWSTNVVLMVYKFEHLSG